MSNKDIEYMKNAVENVDKTALNDSSDEGEYDAEDPGRTHLLGEMQEAGLEPFLGTAEVVDVQAQKEGATVKK
ncbi:hypothetical protein BGZ99_006164 [Dissophora globulifera]|uniref:Uncharacterized protein n=1 Tax=Dissophora globulifera TaxID=979702 RepID=A0A9P6RDB7_9FUNG|nr:hypothetical protein BGZ99_006164 [Dissophora globulifera]